jgi:cyanophycin synthetase
MDYAHNPAALRALGEMLDRIRHNYGRVIGVASMPGDRRDDDIREIGEIAAGIFDLTIFRERPDGRGRPRGGVIELLLQGAAAAGVRPPRVRSILDEGKAVEAALDAARPGDLVVLLPTKVDAVWRQVTGYRRNAGTLSERPGSLALHA